jgi:hypothetical protein
VGESDADPAAEAGAGRGNDEGGGVGEGTCGGTGAGEARGDARPERPRDVLVPLLEAAERVRDAAGEGGSKMSMRTVPAVRLLSRDASEASRTDGR